METWRKELYHHGIKGQKWGVRNGPPYPLDAKDHTTAEKKAGWRSSIAAKQDEVPTNSPNARHIYEKFGFKATGEAMLGDEDDIWGGLTKMRLDL